MIVTQERPGELVGFRLTEGLPTLLWRFPDENLDDDIDLEAVYAEPVVDNGVVYIAAYSGDIIALDVQNGRPLPGWPESVTLDERVVASPAYDGTFLYVATDSGTLRAIDASDGAMSGPLLHINERVWGRVLADGRSIYMVGLDRSVSALDRSTQQLRWVRELDGAVAGDPVLVDGTLYVGALDHRLYALDLDADGAELWRFRGDAWFWARPLVTGSTVYAAALSGSLYAVDRASGALRWETRIEDAQLRTAPVLVDGTLVLASEEGGLFGIDPTSGVALWRHTVEDAKFLADPLVLESGLLFASADGTLVSVTPADGATRVLHERR